HLAQLSDGLPDESDRSGPFLLRRPSPLARGRPTFRFPAGLDWRGGSCGDRRAAASRGANADQRTGISVPITIRRLVLGPAVARWGGGLYDILGALQGVVVRLSGVARLISRLFPV